MRVDRNITKKVTQGSGDPEKPVPLNKEEALSFVWDLTQEIFSLTGRHDVESGLQRHVVAVTRKHR